MHRNHIPVESLRTAYFDPFQAHISYFIQFDSIGVFAISVNILVDREKKHSIEHDNQSDKT